MGSEEAERLGETIEEKKAEILMKLRGYRTVKREDQKDVISFLVRVPKAKKKLLLWCVPTEGTVGVAYINRLKKAMTEAEVDWGIIVSSGRYTSAAKSRATKSRIELVPRIFPAFNIFDHVMVPKHDVLTDGEKGSLLAQLRVEAYQLPWIRASDPAVRAVGARPGDVLKVVRDSTTAGRYVAYRYVVEG
jgi:DNA-directed RNA polymerase subunit H (RpoH/RPB5)